MAEIKSALELALERTKKITISEKEKEEIKRKEIMQKVDGLSHRYMEGYLALSEILREIERMDEKTKTMAKEVLLSQWMDALSLKKEGERVLKGVEAMKGRPIDEVKEKFHHLLSQYEEEEERIRKELRAQMAEALRKKGIWGSAVEPNIEANDLRKKEAENLDQRYHAKLEEIKEQLRAL